MTPSVLIFLASLLVACGVGVYLFYKAAEATPERLALAAAPVLAIVLLGGVVATTQFARLREWSNARLAPAEAFSIGYQLYYPESSGPVLNQIYTPVSALIYYPATLATHPDVAVMIAALISTLMFMVPAVFIVVAATRGNLNKSWHHALLLVFCFWAVSQLIPSLNYAMTRVHADAAALCFAGMACICGAHAPRKIKAKHKLSRALFLACLFATLSFWSKQTMFPIVVAIPVWMFAAAGFRRAVEASVWLLSMSLAALWLVSWHVPLETFFFNILEIPRRHPWNGDSILAPLKELLALEQAVAWLCLIPILAVVLWATRRGSGCLWQIRRFCRENPWSLFVLAGLLSFPTCVLAKVKVGGDINAIAPASYLFLLANAWILTRSWRFQKPIPIGDCGKMTATAFALLLAFVLSQDFAGRLRTTRSPSNTSVAFNYILSGSERAYFPWHPLAHLMAEHRLYHFDYGLFDRQLADHALDRSHLLAGIPKDATLLCLPPDNLTPEYDSGLRAIFPKRVQIDQLPEWTCYERQQ